MRFSRTKNHVAQDRDREPRTQTQISQTPRPNGSALPPSRSPMRQAIAVGAVKSRSEVHMHVAFGSVWNAKREYGAAVFARSACTPGRHGARSMHVV